MYWAIQPNNNDWANGDAVWVSTGTILILRLRSSVST